MPITMGETSSRRASATAPRTRNSAPNNSKMKPAAICRKVINGYSVPRSNRPYQ